MSGIEELEKLAQLRDKGILTEEEFNRKKQELLGFSAAPSVGSVQATEQNSSDVHLWNPNAAANWSLLFTPAFGSYIHALNWKSLGNTKQESKSKIWFYISLIVLLIAIASPEKIAIGLSFWFLIIWYFMAGRAQSRYVKETLANTYKRKSWGKPIGFAIASAFVAIFVIAVAQGSHDSSSVQLVKNGTLDLCKTKTVAAMADGFMGSPKWESGVSADGEEFVNVTGKVSFMNQPVNAKLQFLVDRNSKTFEFHALEFNEIAQNGFVSGALLSKMCE